MTSQNWKQIKDIAIEAWARPASERVAYITTACGDDDHLRTEVLSLVASMEAAEDRFETPPSVPADDILPMSSLDGQRVGPYEILSRIGAGGMGEVYKARDTRLGRSVAIKVLTRTAGDPVSRERMEREARAVAALNHPHICAIYDIGNHDAIDYLVMEFVNGESLATRLSRGELPVADTVCYAEQMATALSEAHRAGIVHRDVKPANIMLHVAADGSTQAKLLDFGVAKANTPEPTSTGQILLRSEAASDLTIAGFIVGTAHYIAPEHLAGHATDRRTDIFAFGAVLFEMLTGHKAFQGSNRDEVLDAIRAGTFPLPSNLRARVPATLDRIVMRCLAPDPSDRYQSADELLVDLRAARRGLDTSPRWRAMTAVAVLLLVTGSFVAWSISARGTTREAGIEPSLIRLPVSAGVLGAPALSPDGSSLVFSWAGEGVDNPELMLLPIGSTTKRQLTNELGIEEWPAWSPDGKEVAFIRCGSANCAIFVLRIEDRVERKLHDLRSDRYYGLAWSPDGASVVYGERASPSEPYGVFELSLRDSSIRRLTSPSGLGDLRFAFSPDGNTLGVIRVGERGIGVHVVALDTRAERSLLQGEQEWFGGLAWSTDGRHLIVSANQQGVRRLWKLSVAGGRLEQLSISGEDAYYPSVEGSRLAFVRSFRDWDFSRMTLSNGKLQAAVPFPSSARLDLDPAFSPDGQKLAFVSERSGTREVWVSNADGSNASQLTSIGGAGTGRPSWSPDGQHIAFHGAGIKVMLAAGGPARRLCGDGETPTWSGDGRWIYFVRTSGTFTLWKVAVTGGNPEQVIASEVFGAREGPHGRELFISRIDGLWRRPVNGGEETPVIPEFPRSFTGYWTVVSDGIYYLIRKAAPGNTFAHHLNFYNFARGQSADLGPLPGFIEDYVGGLTISSDRRTLVYSYRTYESNEIVLVDHFR